MGPALPESSTQERVAGSVGEGGWVEWGALAGSWMTRVPGFTGIE